MVGLHSFPTYFAGYYWQQHCFPSLIELQVLLDSRNYNASCEASYSSLCDMDGEIDGIFQVDFGSNVGANNNQQNMLESYANQPYNAESSYNNVGVVFSSNGAMGHGLMTSANGLRGVVNHGDNQLMYPNYGSLENN
ncbi:hypothetical protein JHK85_025770 [Glycine max]|nr:hypothetical protein JHK85_025770 [Glycine max]KAG5013010.1 hypothetical protein JHK86_025271 [Glycine max]